MGPRSAVPFGHLAGDDSEFDLCDKLPYNKTNGVMGWFPPTIMTCGNIF